MDEFWTDIARQLERLREAKSATEVIDIVGTGEASPGHFAGSGGGDTVYDALNDAEWEIVWYRAVYYWAAKAPDGSHITYIEGDIYPELQQPL
ncbi:hypothetical protein ACTD5D_40260 [Nocardia takedensis]|uniref:hypothetical protein n=1 Tax=Nocardia takedensis TaxID=259390 RepID=UPI003F75ED21